MVGLFKIFDSLFKKNTPLEMSLDEADRIQLMALATAGM
jgi:hypothetical protein